MALVAASVALVVPVALAAVVFLGPGGADSAEFASVDTGSSGEPTLSVITQPHGARVYLNNVLVGVTPFENVPVQPGDYLVTTERDGYVQSDTVLSIRGAANFAFALNPLQDAGLSGSGHVLAGIEDGDGSEADESESTRLRPTPSRPAPARSAVTDRIGGAIERLQPVGRASVDRSPDAGAIESPAPRLGGVRISSEPSGATVWIDGQVVGETPLDLGAVPEGSHTIQITRPNFENFETTIDVSAGSTMPLGVDLKPIVGTIAVIVEPEGMVYVDGVLVGRSVRGLARFEVAPGSHNLRVVNDELGTREFDVDVRPNREAEFNVVFTAPSAEREPASDVRRALSSASDAPPASASVAANPADGGLAEADRLLAGGELEAARQLYEQLVASDPSNGRIANKLAEVDRLLRTQQEQAATEAIIEDGVYLVVDKSPQLIGGLEALHRTVRYPEAALNAGIEGRVFVQFVVDEQGIPTDITVTKGLPMGCNEAAIEAVRNARFIPGEYKGRKVKVRHTLYINFRK